MKYGVFFNLKYIVRNLFTCYYYFSTFTLRTELLLATRFYFYFCRASLSSAHHDQFRGHFDDAICCNQSTNTVGGSLRNVESTAKCWPTHAWNFPSA